MLAFDTPPRTPIPVLIMARELGWGGGLERDISKFARHLLQHGIQPHVACFNPGGMRWREIEAAGIPLLTVPTKSFKSNSAIKGARIDVWLASCAQAGDFTRTVTITFD